MNQLVIDVHSHVFTPAANDVVTPFVAQEDALSFGAGKTSGDYNARQYELLHGKLTDPLIRIADMDQMGVDVQVLSVAPNQYYYWTDPEVGRRTSRIQNERIAEIVAAHPSRFVGMATVPMQDVSAASAELEYGMRSLDLRGVEICTNINGLDLDDPRFRAFFGKAEELGAVVILHPLGTTHGGRLENYYLSNIIGNPLDSTIAVSRLILGGVLEQFPALKLVVVHGGGYLPFYSSRIDHGWNVRPEAKVAISTTSPSDYLHRIVVDTLVFDAAHLEFLIRQMGADHVVIGTDYPYDMGQYDPVETFAKVPGLSHSQRSQITSSVACQLLDLDPDTFAR